MIYPINVEVAVEYGIMSQHCSSTSHTFLCTVSDEPELFRYKSHVPWYCVRWTSTVPVQVTRSFVLCEINLHCSGTSHTFLCTVWDEPALFRYKSHVPLYCVRWTSTVPVQVTRSFALCDICYVNSSFFSVSLCLVIKYLFQTPYKINCPVQSVFRDPESSVTRVFSWNRIWNLPNSLWDDDFDWTLWQDLGLFKTTLFIPPLLSELQDCLLLNTMLVQRNKLTTFCGCDAEEITLNHWELAEIPWYFIVYLSIKCWNKNETLLLYCHLPFCPPFITNLPGITGSQ